MKQDNQCVRNCDDPNPKNHKLFEQPVIQTAQMFVGEAGCWLVVALLSLWQRFSGKRSDTTAEYQPVNTSEADAADSDARSIHSTTALNPTGNNRTKDDDDDGRPLASEETLKGSRVLLLSLPAICDILGTTLMNCGLLLVAASIYQMTRGALVLFVGLFSVIFLKRKLHLFQWVSLGGVVLGVAVVGLAGAIWPDQDKHKDAVSAAEVDAAALLAIGGVAMIAGAQIFTATQFVLEEWLLERSTIDPIRVVGWEGLFGFLVTLSGMVVLHFAIGRTEAGQYGPFDMAEGWKQWTGNPRVLISSILIMFSIGYVATHLTFLLGPTSSRCCITDRFLLVASTSSACPLRAPSAPRPARRSIHAARSSSGSCRSALAGRRSNGCRFWASFCWYTSPSSSTALSRRRLSSSSPRRRSRSCCLRSP